MSKNKKNKNNENEINKEKNIINQKEDEEFNDSIDFDIFEDNYEELEDDSIKKNKIWSEVFLNSKETKPLICPINSYFDELEYYQSENDEEDYDKEDYDENDNITNTRDNGSVNYDEILISGEEFYLILDNIVKTHNINYEKLCKIIGISCKELNKLKEKKELPSINYLGKIAGFANLPLGFLIYNKINKNYDFKSSIIVLEKYFNYLEHLEDLIKEENENLNKLFFDLFPTLKKEGFLSNYIDLKFPDKEFYSLRNYFDYIKKFTRNKYLN